MADLEARGLELPPTPYINDIKKAALRLGYEFGLVRYQILAYAERNSLCHNGIKNMINYGDFMELAERIYEDKRSLEIIFRGRPHFDSDMTSNWSGIRSLHTPRETTSIIAA